MASTIRVAFALTLLAACSPAGSTDEANPSAEESACDPHAELSSDLLAFHASPGGVPEVTVDWVRTHGCHVRVVDVREPEELSSGVIEGAAHVPLGALGREAHDWDPHEPVVLVCRSGRRSARGAQLLEGMGFDQVASMTGGMLAWGSADHPTANAPAPPEAAPVRSDTPTASSLQTYLGELPIRHVRAAALLLEGTESCVDGREEHAVLGTPGGDAGELLLALSTLEELTDRELTRDEVQHFFEAYVEGFGRFYIHTDDHALEALAATLAADPRFRDAHPDPELAPVASRGADWAEALVRHPPQALRAPLLEALTQPDHIGCGHLRLVALHPEEYDVRPGLTSLLLEVTFRTLWHAPEAIDFAVLHGDHVEEAVVNVRLDHGVHAFTNVPAVPPKLGDHSVFVNHPEVAAFIRSQHAAFLLEQAGPLADGISLEALRDALARRATLQLNATVAHLAPELPVFDVTVDERVRVERVR
ncbi:MAG: rhodanese-like domain-containing protein [Deltaproteobacteria bacterium]|nr:rhodanese-like domain-containing protein [Deltaproteobacteria bacterium]